MTRGNFDEKVRCEWRRTRKHDMLVREYRLLHWTVLGSVPKLIFIDFSLCECASDIHSFVSVEFFFFFAWTFTVTLSFQHNEFFLFIKRFEDMYIPKWWKNSRWRLYELERLFVCMQTHFEVSNTTGRCQTNALFLLFAYYLHIQMIREFRLRASIQTQRKLQWKENDFSKKKFNSLSYVQWNFRMRNDIFQEQHWSCCHQVGQFMYIFHLRWLSLRSHFSVSETWIQFWGRQRMQFYVMRRTQIEDSRRSIVNFILIFRKSETMSKWSTSCEFSLWWYLINLNGHY